MTLLVDRHTAATVIPEIAQASEAEWRETEAALAAALARRPAGQRRQLALFVRLLDLLSIARHGRALRRLTAAQRTALLTGLERSRLLLLRRGVWGLRTFVMLAWYARPAVQRALGYRASPAGWARVAPGSAPR